MQRKCQPSFLLEMWVIYTIYAKDVVKYMKRVYETILYTTIDKNLQNTTLQINIRDKISDIACKHAA